MIHFAPVFAEVFPLLELEGQLLYLLLKRGPPPLFLSKALLKLLGMSACSLSGVDLPVEVTTKLLDFGRQLPI
jgi:hypothetical protein